VVVFDGGLTSDALTYVPLNEYLASHGFIVISLPSLPNAEDKPLAFDVAGVESKTRDILTVLQQFDRVPNADTGRIAVAAWSVGGVSTALAQMQNDKVRAVLSLDGGMGYDYGPPLAKQSSLYDVKKAMVPYLHVTGMKPNPYNVPKDFAFFAELPSRQTYLAELQNVNHSHFTVQGGAVAYVGDRSDAAIQFWAANEHLARFALLFLNDFVKTSGGKDFLKRANQLSPAMLKVKPAKAD
jgi:dienelactone hydrolase